MINIIFKYYYTNKIVFEDYKDAWKKTYNNIIIQSYKHLYNKIQNLYNKIFLTKNDIINKIVGVITLAYKKDEEKLLIITLGNNITYKIISICNKSNKRIEEKLNYYYNHPMKETLEDIRLLNKVFKNEEKENNIIQEINIIETQKYHYINDDIINELKLNINKYQEVYGKN